MKKILSIFLICFSTLAYANEDPIFEEDEDNERKACEECGDPRHNKGEDDNTYFRATEKNTSKFRESRREPLKASYMSWTRYKANFGIEKILVRFPQKPTVSRSNALLTAYAYDCGVLYSLTGYFPPIGSINSALWFDEMLYSVNHYPYNLISSIVFQIHTGEWVMDYVSHDYVQNLIVKGHAIATPFNGYTLQCIKPNGSRDYFDYFLDNVSIRCVCN